MYKIRPFAKIHDIIFIFSKVTQAETMKSSSILALSVALFSGPSLSQGYTNQSEVPLYGQSPPVYPSRKFIDGRPCRISMC